MRVAKRFWDLQDFMAKTLQGILNEEFPSLRLLNLRRNLRRHLNLIEGVKFWCLFTLPLFFLHSSGSVFIHPVGGSMHLYHCLWTAIIPKNKKCAKNTSRISSVCKIQIAAKKTKCCRHDKNVNTGDRSTICFAFLNT